VLARDIFVASAITFLGRTDVQNVVHSDIPALLFVALLRSRTC
jgi:hypothetical protein